MRNPEGEANTLPQRLHFDRRLKLEFHGSRITSDAGLLAYCELDYALGLTDIAADALVDNRKGKNGLHGLVGLLRQSVYGRLAGYEDVNDADRLGHDPAMRWSVGGKAIERGRLSRSASVAKPIDYLLRRWADFTRFLDDGRICLTNNAAERALRGFALGRKSWLFAGSMRGGDRAAAMVTLLETAKLNNVDPQAWLADVLARIADTPQNRLTQLLPWEWRKIPGPAAQ